MSQFNCRSLVYLLLVLMFSSGAVLRHMSIYVTDLYNKVLYSGSNVLLQHSSPDMFTPVILIGSMSLCRGRTLATFLIMLSKSNWVASTSAN